MPVRAIVDMALSADISAIKRAVQWKRRNLSLHLKNYLNLKDHEVLKTQVETRGVFWHMLVLEELYWIAISVI